MTMTESRPKAAMNEAEHILVVDDEPGIRNLLERYLSRQGYRVSTAANGEAMREILIRDKADLVILDLVMPGEDGLTLTRRLRREFDMAVIILTLKGDDADRITGLETGADDYVTKPFNIRELHARVKSVLRRVKAPAAPGDRGGGEAGDIVYRFAGWRLDHANRELTSPGGEAVPLTRSEFELLAAFLRHPKRLLNRDQIMAYAWNREWTPLDRGIDVQIGRLRRKIGDDPSRPSLIKTVRGGGYMFTAGVETETAERG